MTKIKTIYRLQTRNGTGVYRAPHSYFFMKSLTLEESVMQRPNPHNDKKLYSKWNMLTDSKRELLQFAFKSLKQLYAWFSRKEIETMERFGVFIHKIIISIDHIIPGLKQVAYYYNKQLSIEIINEHTYTKRKT